MFKSSLEMAQKSNEGIESVFTRRELSISYRDLGEMYQAVGEYDLALSMFESCKEIIKPLTEEFYIPQNRVNVALIHDRFGMLFAENGREEEGLQQLEISLQQLKQLATEFGSAQYTLEMKVAYEQLERLYTKRGQSELARVMAEKLSDLQ